MFEQVLSKDAKKSLAVLGKSRLLEDSYLAGGTALALQIGHRISVDFDFFTNKEFNGNIFARKLKKLIPDFRLERTGAGTLLGNINKIRFSLFFYDYPLLFKKHNFLCIKIADIKDIAAMKIAAISGRGTKRDFMDLYFITQAIAKAKRTPFFSLPSSCKRDSVGEDEDLSSSPIKVEKILSLDEILRLYDKKFGLLEQNKIHILKSLVYFEDAEEEPKPIMIKPIEWEEVKKAIRESVLKIGLNL